MDLVDIPVPSGSAEAYVARPDSGSGPGVLFFMDAIGLRPQIADMCDRIASWGYVVVAPNVFHREGTADEVGPRADLREPGAREEFFAEAMPRVHRLTADLAVPDIAAYTSFLRDLDGVTDGPMGTTGYCMGARLAVRAAGAHSEEYAACGGFHGGGLATDDPDSPHLVLSHARASFVFGHADRDRSMPLESIAVLGATHAAQDLTFTNEVYPDAPHGYTMADTASYQEAGAERHFTELEALFARTL
jgi:carboxymethylenebutenolidase